MSQLSSTAASPSTPARSTRSTSATWTSSSRGSRLFDRLIVGVGINPDKAPFFDLEERVELLREVIAASSATSRCGRSPAWRCSSSARSGPGSCSAACGPLSDMEYEFTMSLMNLNLDPEIETVFLMAKEEYSHVSSSLLRQIATFGGDLDEVPAARRSTPPSDACKSVRERLSPPDVGTSSDTTGADCPRITPSMTETVPGRPADA